MPRIKPAVLKWKREREARGQEIMGGEEFKRRTTGLMKHAGFSKEAAQRIVGRQYWNKVKEKFKERRGRVKRKGE